ncbi:MAG: hypothetical protein A4E33_00488 [Methanoregula sp. PtaB.Bin085]|nr:MAG: hypothetical protein A4E33_00488 [Methanoregula sp. PtaB.Bin085]
MESLIIIPGLHTDQAAIVPCLTTRLVVHDCPVECSKGVVIFLVFNMDEAL